MSEKCQESEGERDQRNQNREVIPGAADAAAEEEAEADGVRGEERGKCWNPQQ